MRFKKSVKEIDKKRMAIKCLEDGVKKGVELCIVAIVIGLSIQTIAIVLPAVMIGSFLAKMLKIMIFG